MWMEHNLNFNYFSLAKPVRSSDFQSTECWNSFLEKDMHDNWKLKTTTESSRQAKHKINVIGILHT